MKRLNLIILCLILIPNFANAARFNVYDYKTNNAYLLEQPAPGVYLGQMLRNIGLAPDWKNRQWIQAIHGANPEIVDQTGEILFHVQKIKIPLSAIRPLKGYAKLENHFQPYDEPIPEVAQVPNPISPPIKREEITAEVVKEKFQPLYAFDTLIGGGAEALSADDPNGNDTELNSEANFLATFRFFTQLKSNHQLGFSAQYKYKTYSPPIDVALAEDNNHIITLKYNYGYRLMNSFYMRLVGQSQNLNFIQFPSNEIAIFTYWAHSAGLQFDAALINFNRYQLFFKMDGKYIYETSSDFDIDPGFLASLTFEIAPNNLGSGFIVGLTGDYHNQVPAGFDAHTAIEISGYLGYRF